MNYRTFGAELQSNQSCDNNFMFPKDLLSFFQSLLSDSESL